MDAEWPGPKLPTMEFLETAWPGLNDLASSTSIPHPLHPGRYELRTKPGTISTDRDGYDSWGKLGNGP